MLAQQRWLDGAPGIVIRDHCVVKRRGQGGSAVYGRVCKREQPALAITLIHTRGPFNLVWQFLRFSAS